MGKMLLALADDPAAEVAALGALERFTERTLTDPAALVAELEAIRRRGWSLNDGERDPGVRAVAVAIPGPRRHAAAMAVQGPEVRLTDDRLASVVALLDSTVGAGVGQQHLVVVAPDGLARLAQRVVAEEHLHAAHRRG